MSPRVSVVIPVFNRPAAVRRAIESVLAQTCQDFEIIVVDDGSTDGTAAAVAALGDRRIALIRHERNRGGSAARNTGIRAGSAPYVAFLDSDDEWLPTKLERQLEVFESAGDEVALVYTGTERVYPDGTIRRDIARRHTDLALRLLTWNVVGETSVGMIRRSTLDAIGGFDESLPAAQDMDLWLRLCERFRAELVPEALVRVTKADHGRISVNFASSTKGRELFRRKHGEKLVRHGLLHIYLRDTGWWWYQRRARDSVQARRCYLEALAASPIAPVTYVRLLISYMPVSWLVHLAGSKHRLTALLYRRRAAVQIDA